MSNTSNNKTANSKPTKSKDKDKLRVIVGEIGRDSKTGILGRGYSSDNGKTFHVTDTMYGRLYDPNDIDGIWNGGTADRVKKEVDSATAEIPAAVSAANSAVSAAESAVAASKVNSDAIVAQSEAISEAKSAMDSATAEIQQTAANAASDAAKIRADVARVQNEVDTAKAANSASVEALKSDVSAAKQDLADVHDSLTKAQSAIEQNQKLINDNVAKITSDVSATKQDLATVHDSLTKAQAAAEQNQKAINDSIAEINANVDATNQDLAGVRKDLTKAQSDITANQKAVNDNVAQINSDIAQDRKDIASAQQANADTAKQLDTYSKQAAEQGKTIKTIQDKQDGFTATLADVQGNVSQVSDKVDGLSANLKDAQGNVASVKAQADQLSATLTDHAKSIATLTASAKELSSTLEDADGRLSKVEQTAQTNSSTLSDVQGDLSQVKQNATKLVSTLKDAQGNISTLQQKADSLSTQLASAQGDIATLQTGIDGVKAILTSHDKSIHTLQLDSKSLKDSMADAQGDISTLRKTATDVTSELEDHTGRLSKVEQSAAKQATTLSDLQGNLSQVKQQADGLVTTLKDAQGDITQIQQKADGTLAQLKSAQGDIASLQTDVTGIKATLISHEGDIHTLQADSKTLKDDMTDAQGNISSLQKSSTKLNSEFSSQDGRLSKVEQTANEHTSTISSLGDKLSNMKIGGRNLVVGTGQDTVIDDTANTGTRGWCFWVFNLAQQPKVGDQITVSSESTLTGKGNLGTYEVILYNSTTTANRSNSRRLTAGKRSSATLEVTNLNGTGDTVLLIYAGNIGDTEGKKLVLHHLKVELGNVATDWTPAPEDLATVTQVKQTADGIKTTLKSAQGDIDQIKQTAKGTSEQLADVQGDVTNIQKDVNGLKQTTADNAGNIHTLQSDSKSLHDSMQDAQGDISTLKKTSTDVTAELQDHAGRISKTEQTASTLVNELADQQGHLNRVEQTAQGTQQTVANQQGQINDIKTDAAGIHQALTGQGNQIANINVTLSGLNSKYEGVSGDLDKLKDSNQWKTVNGAFDANQYNQTARIFYQDTQAKNTPDPGWFYLLVEAPRNDRVTQTLIKDTYDNSWSRFYTGKWSVWTKGATQLDIDSLSNQITTNSTQITQNQQAIALKADQDTVNNLSGEVSQAQAQLKVQAGQISSKVSSTDFKTLDDKVNGIQVGGRNLITGTSSNWAKVTNDWGPNWSLNPDEWKAGDTITISTEIRNGSQNIFIGFYNTVNGQAITVPSKLSIPAGEEGRLIFAYKLPEGTTEVRPTIYPASGKGTFEYRKLKAEKGNIATDWTPAPEDLTTAIQKNTTAIDQTNQKISLKANQTEVDQVKQTATQNSSRLNVMVNEISSKVTSTDVNNIVDSKGYATTSTVQSLITQKAGTINESITSLDAKYNTTVTQVQSLTASIDGLQSTVANKADKSQITQLSNAIQSKVSASDFNDLKDKTTWKSTDSIDLNTAVSQQKIFVKGGSNLPPGSYWWYVQVEAGYDSRIVQYAVSDRDNIHYSRQYDGSKWSAWSQGATESEITQLRDDINLRVKSGDLLSQINLTAHNTLIQSNKIYLDSSSTVFSGKAFIPSAAIVNLDVAKLNAGTISTDRIHIGDDSVYLSVKNNYLRLDGSNTKDKYQLRLTGNDIEFADNDSSNWEYRIQHGIAKYQTDEDGLDFDVYSKRGGANHTVMAVSDAGVMVSPSLFFQTDGIDSSNWMGFTRNTVDGNTSLSFHTWNDENEGFHVDCGARFMNYVYINGYARAQGWLTNSTLSKKTNIRKLDLQTALDKIRQDDQYLYEYKRNVAKGIYDPQASFIIDDVNDVAQYSVPREFIDQTGNYREPNVELAYLVAAFQALDKQVQEQNETIKKLEAKLNE